MRYKNELAIIQDILTGGTLIEEISIKYRFGPNEPLFQFFIGHSEDKDLVKRETWAS